MEYFNSYFSKLVFTRQNDNRGWSVYAAKIQAGLANSKRYIILFVKPRFNLPDTAHIFELDWVNLQARELKGNTYKIKPHRWLMPRNAPDIDLTVVNRTAKQTTYGNPTFPVKVELLHDERNSSIYQYRKNMTLKGCLEMYKTVCTYTPPPPPVIPQPIEEWTWNSDSTPIVDYDDDFITLD